VSHSFSTSNPAAGGSVCLAPDADAAESQYLLELARVHAFELSRPPSQHVEQTPQLRWDGERVYLEARVRGQRITGCVDFLPLLKTRRRRLTRDQPFARALGGAAGRILDATAGFGQDALLMALAGHAVVAVERSPVLVALLEDGWRRALANPFSPPRLAERLSWVCADSRDYLREHARQFDAVYLDPMFPERRKRSALPKRHLQLLRRISLTHTASTGTPEQLLECALAHAAGRIVVKRPAESPALGAPAHRPTTSFSAKLVRYDVYRGQHGSKC
jgi:16S rRNA (guanine1516-N2)-methyltransferase